MRPLRVRGSVASRLQVVVLEMLGMLGMLIVLGVLGRGCTLLVVLDMLKGLLWGRVVLLGMPDSCGMRLMLLEVVLLLLLGRDLMLLLWGRWGSVWVVVVVGRRGTVRLLVAVVVVVGGWNVLLLLWSRE